MSEEDTAEAYLEERVLNQIDWYSRKSGYNKTWFRVLRLFEIIVGALIPFWVVLSEVLKDVRGVPMIFKIVIAGSGVIIAAITAIQGVCKFQEHWMAYRTVCERLRHELYFYETGCEHYKGKRDKLCILVSRVERLISEENTDWLAFTKNAEKKNE